MLNFYPLVSTMTLLGSSQICVGKSGGVMMLRGLFS